MSLPVVQFYVCIIFLKFPAPLKKMCLVYKPAFLGILGLCLFVEFGQPVGENSMYIVRRIE